MKSLNLLYCFDENYNYQAFSSMISVLDKVSSKVNFFVIHKVESNSNFVPQEILTHNNTNKFHIFKFNKELIEFPNLLKSHVSEATYYRIFLEKYIKEDIDHLIYLDSDIICVDDPAVELTKFLDELKESNFTIAAKTEYTFKGNENRFERLNMKSDKYFNAGLILIDFKKWKQLDITSKLILNLKSNAIDLIYWDQDLLNNFFDGQYLEISNSLNANLDLENSSTDLNQAIFIHFYGKSKPWVGKGLYTKNSKVYQEEYRKFSKYLYHIEHRWIRSSIVDLLKSFQNKSFWNIEFKLAFIYEFLKTVIKKLLKNKLKFF